MVPTMSSLSLVLLIACTKSLTPRATMTVPSLHGLQVAADRVLGVFRGGSFQGDTETHTDLGGCLGTGSDTGSDTVGGSCSGSVPGDECDRTDVDAGCAVDRDW